MEQETPFPTDERLGVWLTRLGRDEAAGKPLTQLRKWVATTRGYRTKGVSSQTVKTPAKIEELLDKHAPRGMVLRPNLEIGQYPRSRVREYRGICTVYVHGDNMYLLVFASSCTHTAQLVNEYLRGALVLVASSHGMAPNMHVISVRAEWLPSSKACAGAILKERQRQKPPMCRPATTMGYVVGLHASRPGTC